MNWKDGVLTTGLPGKSQATVLPTVNWALIAEKPFLQMSFKDP